MAEEANTAAQPAEPQIINPQTAPKGAEGTAFLSESGPERSESKPIFEDENVTDAMLRGEDDGGTSAKPELDLTEKKEPTKAPEKPAETVKEEGKKEEAKPEVKAEEKPAGKPPEGFVPLAALHEERGLRKRFQSENTSLFMENRELKSTVEQMNDTLARMQSEGKEVPVARSAADQFADFKVLSDDEFEELKSTDPTEALSYMRKEQAYNRYVAGKMAEDAKVGSIIDDSYRVVREEAPDVFNPESGYPEKLQQFAIDNGFHQDFIAPLTNPNTKLVIPTQDGRQVSVPLGYGAASVMLLLHRLYQKGPVTEESIKAQLTEKLEPEITSKLMQKLKNNGSGQFRSIEDIAASSEGTVGRDTKQPLTEHSYERMTAEEQRAYLGG